MEVDEKRNDCKVCFSAFDSSEKRPRCLPCGHTFCSKCVIDNLKKQILVCPSCRKEHKANNYTDFPVNYDMESLLQDETSSQLSLCGSLGTPSDSLAPSSKSLCPPSESLCSPSEESRGISKKLKSMKVELSSGMEGIKASSQDVSSQLHQYKSQMMEWKEQHQKIMERLIAMVHQQERMIKHIDEESYRVGEAIKEGEDEKQRMKKAEDNLAAASTAHDVIPALEEADHCFDVLDNWNHKAQEQFPDIQLIIRSEMLREQTKSALKTLSTIEEEEEEGKGEASALSANLRQQNLVDSSEDKTATAAAVAASFSTDSMLKIQEKVTKALEKVSEYIVATLTSNIQEKGIQAEVQQINQSIQTHLTSSVTVQDLKQMTPFVRQMLESGRVFAVRENEGEEGGMRCAKISLHQNRLCLHVLTKDMSLPDDAFYLEHGDVMRLVDPSSRITFMDLCPLRGSTLGRLYIRLNGDTKGAQQFALLCTGEMGPSYAHTNILRVVDKGFNNERVLGGDIKRNDGEGGKVLVEGLMGEYGRGGEYMRPRLAGSVCGGWRMGEAKAAEFLIFTRDIPGKVLVYCIGMVEEEGLSVLTEAISHYPNINDVTIDDCGIVLPL